MNIPIRGAVVVLDVISEPGPATITRSVGSWVAYNTSASTASGANTITSQRFNVGENTGEDRSTTFNATATTPTNSAYYGTSANTLSVGITQTGIPAAQWTFYMYGAQAMYQSSSYGSYINFNNDQGDNTFAALADGATLLSACGLQGTVYANNSTYLSILGEHSFIYSESGNDWITFYLNLAEITPVNYGSVYVYYGITLVNAANSALTKSKQGSAYNNTSVQIEFTNAELQQVASGGGSFNINFTFTFY